MRLSFLVESPILYLAFFKTILAALFRAFGLPLSFLPSKPSFLHDHSTTQHSNFSRFLAISTTNKPVINRSIQAYALSQLNVFALRGFIFRDIHTKDKNKQEVRAIRAMKYKKYVTEKYTRARSPLARKYTNRIFESKDDTSMKIVNYIERHNFCWNDLLTKSNCTQIQTYEVEERTFGTTCNIYPTVVRPLSGCVHLGYRINIRSFPWYRPCVRAQRQFTNMTENCCKNLSIFLPLPKKNAIRTRGRSLDIA